MARLPQPGGDDGTWGQVLNEFLGVAHNADGSLKTSPAPVQSVNGKTGTVSLTASDVGADAAGAASTAQANAQSAAQTYTDTKVATSPAYIQYDTSSSAYPARSTATSSSTRVVIWIGPVAPSVGGSGAVNNVDVWWRTS